MKKIYLFFMCAVFIFASCSKDEDNNDSVSTDYLIVNNGNGGVNSASDDSDNIPLSVVQAVPADQDGSYSNKIPILLFFDDKILLDSVEDNFEVTQNGNKIGGTVSINEGANGFAILTFIPSGSFDAGAAIELTLKQGFQDDCGNTFEEQDYTLTYQTNSTSSGNFDGNGSLENSDGILFLGDGNLMQGAQGCVNPTDGSNFGAITSGDQLISTEDAIGGASSLMILGPITSDVSNISFDYNFLSSEFQEYTGSQFDDSVIVTVVGDNGAYSEFLTSVNTVGQAGNTQCNGFPNMPDDGDAYAGETGWISKNMSVGNLNGPVYIIFTVTDVSDQIYSSVLAVDNVSY